MKKFQGFPSGKTRIVPIPSAFFTEIVPVVDDIHVLKLLLHFFRALDFQDGKVRYIKLQDLLEEPTLLAGIADLQEEKEKTLLASLDTAVACGYLLKGEINTGNEDPIFFLNSPRGRDALSAYLSGKWILEGQRQPKSLPLDQPGIFQIYEENIGPITPMIADLLQEAEKNYPQAIIQYAFEEAVKQNARNWKYIDAILRNWQEKGSHGTNSSDPEKDRRKYYEGEYAEFINHE